jgi:hypothetical protein
MTEATLERDWSEGIPRSRMVGSNYSTVRTSFEDIRSLATSRQLAKANTEDCINAYARAIQYRRSDLILVTENLFSLEPMVKMYHYNSIATLRHKNHGSIYSCAAGQFDWICMQFSTKDCPHVATCSKIIEKWNRTQTPGWKPFGDPVLYCLYEKVEEQCVLRFSTPLAWAVTCLNAVKIFVLLWIFFFFKEQPLLTIGDAVMSFLVRPDITTKSLGMMGRSNINWWTDKPLGLRYVIKHDGKKNIWWRGVSQVAAMTTILPLVSYRAEVL